MSPRTPRSGLLTPKQLEVVNQFLLHDTDYLANPALLRRNCRGRISKAWAREVCNRLVDDGILVVELRRPRNQGNPTKHYRLNSTPEGFRSLVRAWMGTLARTHGPGWELLAAQLYVSAYARDRLSPDFVRGVLAARDVEIRYAVDSLTGAPRLADARPADWSSSTSRLRDSVPLCFPVSSPGESAQDLKESVRYFFEGDCLGPSLFERVVANHYRHLEDRLLILPILALLQVSPTALLGFLGDWQVYETESMSGRGVGVEMVEHLLFGLVFSAIADIAKTRDVSYGLDVTFAEVRPEHDRAQRHAPALLQLSWRYDEIIGFEAGFDTDHFFVAGDEGGLATEFITEATRNPENCWVCIWWDRQPPTHADDDGIETQIRYRFEDRRRLEKALTHPSAPEATNDTREFVKLAAWLGDAILASVATSELFERLGPARAKQLHEHRESLTTNVALSNLADSLGLPALIRVGDSLAKNPKAVDCHQMHATHLEALVGAVFLDGGLQAAQGVARGLLEESLEEIAPRWGRHFLALDPPQRGRRGWRRQDLGGG